MAAVSRPSYSHSRATKLVERQHTGTSAPASVPDTWPHSFLHNEDPQHRPPTIAARNGSTLTSHFSQLGYVGFHALVPFQCNYCQVPHSFSCSTPLVPRARRTSTLLGRHHQYGPPQPASVAIATRLNSASRARTALQHPQLPNRRHLAPPKTKSTPHEASRAHKLGLFSLTAYVHARARRSPRSPRRAPRIHTPCAALSGQWPLAHPNPAHNGRAELTRSTWCT